MKFRFVPKPSFFSDLRSRSAPLRRFSDAGEFFSDDRIPVLIVGAGPVGLVLAMLLTKLGVRCAILEQNRAFSQHPQAHFINNRSMELFRKLDSVAVEIQKLQPPIDLWRKFVYCTSLSGSILGSVDHMQPQDFDKVVSPTSVGHFSQYKLTRVLLLKLENMGFRVCTPENSEALDFCGQEELKILMGHKCISISPGDKGVTVEASYDINGKLQNRNIFCSILIGADGAGSMVRRLAGIDMEGEKDLQRLISIHFLSRDLGNYLLQERPGMLFFIFNTEGIGVLVAHDLSQGEFVLQVPFYPPQQSIDDFNSKVCKDIISKLSGRNLLDVEIVDRKPWVMHAEVAEKYTSFCNRVILVGDAAHRFPPAGGFGMNTGIQDAHNLAWKIASVHRRIFSDSILHTYETERRPIALFNTSLSIENFKAAMSIPSALGLDPKVANTVHRVIDSGFGAVLPLNLQKLALEGLMAFGRAQLSDTILNENNPLGASRLAKVRSILEDGKSLQLQFPAEDIGFRYRKGALVQDTDDETEDAAGATCSKRVSREYTPSAKPGSRLPHMNVRPLQALPSQEVTSTLDLIPGDKLDWLLIIAPRKKSYDLAHAALDVAKSSKLPLKICIIWPQGSSGRGEMGSKSMFESRDTFMDVEEVITLQTPTSWWEVCQMTSEGAILVRPDEHIAWRAESDVAGDLNIEMLRVFSLISGNMAS